MKIVANSMTFSLKGKLELSKKSGHVWLLFNFIRIWVTVFLFGLGSLFSVTIYLPLTLAR